MISLTKNKKMKNIFRAATSAGIIAALATFVGLQLYRQVNPYRIKIKLEHPFLNEFRQEYLSSGFIIQGVAECENILTPLTGKTSIHPIRSNPNKPDELEYLKKGQWVPVPYYGILP